MKSFYKYNESLFKISQKIDTDLLKKIIEKIKKTKKNNKIILVGNGGSSSISNHVAVDISKILKIRAITFNEPNLITCYANDYKYENWVREAIKSYGIKNDIAIFISSSGMSKNLINGCIQANKMGIFTITLSGFKKTNELKKRGKINLWVNSNHYNFVEICHQNCLLFIVDYLSKNLSDS